MEEILQKLLESDVLSEETKADLTEAWAEAVKAKKTEITEQVTLEVRAELAEQWVKERDALIGKLDEFVSEQIETEFNELRSDIESFRDLEAEYAGKLVTEKQAIAESMNEELEVLIDKIDAFFEERLTEELDELKEDLEFAKQNDFGRKIFEAFAPEYAKFVDEDAIQSKLAIAEAKLVDAKQALAEAEKTTGKLLREQKMEQLLKPLSGAKREQMQFVLQNIETTKLDEAYNHFIGRVLKEETSTKTSTVISEGKTKSETTVKTGDVEDDFLSEERQTAKNSMETLKRLAGISS
jgi:hypothetical protein